MLRRALALTSLVFALAAAPAQASFDFVTKWTPGSPDADSKTFLQDVRRFGETFAGC